MIEFDYRQERLSTGDTIYRPIAKISLRRFESENEWIAEYFYIDSGADYTLLPYRMGRFLGLEKVASSEVREIGGIGGMIAARFALMGVQIGDYQFECPIAWAQIEHVPFLLGREGVFDHFDITFRQTDKKTLFVWRK